MEVVYVLHHVRSADEDGDDAKLIGVYGSRQAANDAIRRLADKPGFREHPDGFVAERYELGKDHWTEGFVRSTDELNDSN